MSVKKILVILWMVLITSSLSHAGSPVWKVSKDGSTLFIGGTIHVLGEADYPLPKAFDKAFYQSEVLVFETDIAATQRPEFARQMMGQMVYQDGRTLKTLLTPGTYSALDKFSRDRGIAMADMNGFKPGLVMIFLTLAEAQRLGVGGAGVDEFYYQKGIDQGRSMYFLERPMDQIRFLADIGVGNEEEMIAYILKDLESLPQLLKTMKSAWRKGDTQTLYTATLAPLKKDHPELYQTLMVKRNMAWLPMIEKMATTPETEFILVGAAHLAGDQGLLSLLKAKGFVIANQSD